MLQKQESPAESVNIYVKCSEAGWVVQNGRSD